MKRKRKELLDKDKSSQPTDAQSVLLLLTTLSLGTDGWLRVDASSTHMRDNNGSWRAHFSVTRVRGRCNGLRVSLCTKDRRLARQRRDQLLDTYPGKVEALPAEMAEILRKNSAMSLLAK